eukprot:CAMPEP_0185199926 /NCGR_PEP_ID=MMETSP1140-20130426/46168_1 /TAXON_ID=298111 /ORGANISM="Pavlova sp., Strain CCMP459" /LENGTH=33 /DNA_ID= /DNA_START= /DNA_END= /DNA_ORIENTATION=
MAKLIYYGDGSSDGVTETVRGTPNAAWSVEYYP